MKLKDEKKEQLKRDIQHPDNKRQKREFMDAEQKEENKKNSDKRDTSNGTNSNDR